VIAEQRDGALNRASWEAVAAAQHLAAGQPVAVAIAGGDVARAAGASAGGDVARAAGEIAAADVAEVITITASALAGYTADGWVAAHRALVDAVKPSFVLLTHTYQTRDFAPALPSALDRALITDGTAIKAGASGPLFTRPMFQGKLAADARPPGDAPCLDHTPIAAVRAR